MKNDSIRKASASTDSKTIEDAEAKKKRQKFDTYKKVRLTTRLPTCPHVPRFTLLEWNLTSMLQTSNSTTTNNMTCESTLEESNDSKNKRKKVTSASI